MSQFVYKLKKLQRALVVLRRKYVNVLEKADALRTQLAQLQDLKAQVPQDLHIAREEHDLRKDFVFWNRAALIYMNQKAKEQWVANGDGNTKYFHALLKKNNYHKHIYSVTTDAGEVINDYRQVVQHFCGYYV